MLWMRKSTGPLVAINHKPRLSPRSPYFGESFIAEAKRQGKNVVYWEKNVKPDIILMIDWTKDLELFERYRKMGVKVVHRIDGAGIVHPEQPKQDNIIYQTFEKVDAVIFQSDFCKEIWERSFKLEKPYYIVYNGADERVFSREGKKNNLGFKRFMVTGARWRPWKGLDQMVEVFLNLNREDFGFVVVGDGAEALKHPNILTTGKLGHKEMAEVFRAADLFLYLPWQEWCPKVVVRAILTGLPVVCSYRGGTRELVGDCGFAVHGEKDNDLEDFGPNPVNLAETVKAVNSILDKGEKCRERPDLYLSTMVKNYFDVFEKVLDQK
jgi:glycosyltransferase involved in cell wall biosynthesis